MAETNKRIGKMTMIAMITISVLFDIIELILDILVVGLIINRIIIFIKWVIFWAWFEMKGVSFTKLNGKNAEKRMWTAVATIIIGAIPIIGAFPEFTIGIIRMIMITNLEDLEKATLSNIPGGEQLGERITARNKAGGENRTENDRVLARNNQNNEAIAA